MAKLDEKICGLVCGDTWPIDRTYQDVALIGLTLTQAILVIKRKEKDNDAAAVAMLTITTGAGVDGQITDATPGDGTVAMYFRIPPATSLLLKPGRAYVYGIKVQDSGGGRYTMEKGTIVGERQVVTT